MTEHQMEILAKSRSCDTRRPHRIPESMCGLPHSDERTEAVPIRTRKALNTFQRDVTNRLNQELMKRTLPVADSDRRSFYYVCVAAVSSVFPAGFN
jgi:hypothetical protein